MATKLESVVGGNEAGFSLIETMIAMAILATGLLSMAGVFIMGLSQLSASSASLIAREKAREAVESVHTARDIGTLRWCRIRNAGAVTDCADGAEGAFLADAQPLLTAGNDGLINTGDAGEELEVSLGPGPDEILGTADDTSTPMTNYTRQIIISDLVVAGVTNVSLRRVTVTIGFRVGPTQRTYTLTTFISSIS